MKSVNCKFHIILKQKRIVSVIENIYMVSENNGENYQVVAKIQCMFVQVACHTKNRESKKCILANNGMPTF